MSGRNADAPTFSERHNATVISKPHEEDQPFNEFLDYIIRQEIDPAFPKTCEVRYAQTRKHILPFLCRPLDPYLILILLENDNFRNEYALLFNDAQKDIPFARIALQKDPDAINLWIGNSRSTTALHRDPMENIYVQVLGQKHFVLLPPLCHPCVSEQLVKSATYARNGDELELTLDDGADDVPLARWDPDNPTMNATEFSHLAKPIHVTLKPGDMLYLPAMW